MRRFTFEEEQRSAHELQFMPDKDYIVLERTIGDIAENDSYSKSYIVEVLNKLAKSRGLSYTTVLMIYIQSK